MKALSEPIPVNNAGILLINQFFPLLFKRMELLDGLKFSTIEGQKEAVQVLQYVATENRCITDAELPLNKVLCNLSLETSVNESIELPYRHKEIVYEMLRSAILGWKDVEHQSVEDFRKTFFFRDAMLWEYEDKWLYSAELWMF